MHNYDLKLDGKIKSVWINCNYPAINQTLLVISILIEIQN